MDDAAGETVVPTARDALGKARRGILARDGHGTENMRIRRSTFLS
ncbi:hypothetical protein [Paraburkholderia sp. GAS334]